MWNIYAIVFAKKYAPETQNVQSDGSQFEIVAILKYSKIVDLSPVFRTQVTCSESAFGFKTVFFRCLCV